MLVAQLSPDVHATREQRVCFVEEEHRTEFARALEAGGDVLGSVAEVFRDHRAVIDLVERLAEPQRHAESGARLARAGRAVEVEDAAAVLRLELADAPDRFQIGASLDGAQAGGDVVAHVRVEHEPFKLVVRLRGDEHAEIGRVAVGCTVIATARVAVIGRSSGVRW